MYISFKDPTDCGPKTCKNGGVCIEKWIENKKMCNCDFTSYTGNNCDKSLWPSVLRKLFYNYNLLLNEIKFFPSRKQRLQFSKWYDHI